MQEEGGGEGEVEWGGGLTTPLLWLGELRGSALVWRKKYGGRAAGTENKVWGMHPPLSQRILSGRGVRLGRRGSRRASCLCQELTAGSKQEARCVCEPCWAQSAISRPASRAGPSSFLGSWLLCQSGQARGVPCPTLSLKPPPGESPVVPWAPRLLVRTEWWLRTGTIFVPWEEKLDLPWEGSTQSKPSMGLNAERAKAPPSPGEAVQAKTCQQSPRGKNILSTGKGTRGKGNVANIFSMC